MAQCNICNGFLDYVIPEQLTKEDILGYRETLACTKCGSISRDRGMMWALSSCINHRKTLFEQSNNKKIKILESFGLRYYPKILKEKFTYYNTRYSKFLPKLKLFPKKFADLQKLFYSNEQFDFVITSDIFEHVRLDDKAFSEVYRVLKPNGYLLMTIPFDYSLNKTDEKVKITKNGDIFIKEPEYHNKGIKDGGDSLSYRIYGKSLFEKLTNYGFNVMYLKVQIPKNMISPIELFFCRKNQEPKIETISNKIQVLNKELFTRY